MTADRWTIPLPGAPGPVEALRRIRGRAHRVLLETADAAPGGGRSFLAADPVAILTSRLGRCELRGALPGIDGLQGLDPFAALERLLHIAGGVASTDAASLPVPAPAPTPPRGTRAGEVGSVGGCFGYLGYEAGDVLERLPAPQVEDGAELPESWFGVFPWTVAWEEGVCELRGRLLPGMDRQSFRRELETIRGLLTGEPDVARRDVQPAQARDSAASPALEGFPLPGRPDAVSSLGGEGFRAGVAKIQEYIRAGDLFQANLTHRISRATSLDGEALLGRLRAESAAPFLAYIDTGEGEVVSISPESFLALRGGRVETRPIKGTAPRGATPEEDRHLAAALEASEKDRAENVMIVDLLRNDLSRVCAEGSVTVPDLLRLESHPTVHHLVSTIRGDLRTGVRVIDLLRATFPGGSITGAPKIRAIEVLRELEPVRRGVYTGALGMLTFEGDATLSIAIRTAVVRDGVARYGAGGGITLASDPWAEWKETLDKAAAFLKATDP